MRALRIHAYGGPEVLHLENIAVPVAGKGQLLVKVRAASVNPIDWKIRRGMLAGIFPVSFPRTLGRDCAGETESGKLFAGVSDLRTDGTHAEFVLLPESQLAAVPAGLGAAEAASLCIAGLSAYVPLVEVAQVKAGMKVLVHAGAGGVGSLAIQIARHLGADVTATASPANRDYCMSLGASRVIDYRNETLEQDSFDIVLDTIGGETHRRSIQALKPGGVLVALAAAPIPDGPERPGARVIMAKIQTTRERLEKIFAWAACGDLRPQVKHTFPLEDAAEAYAASESGHSRGKIVIVP